MRVDDKRAMALQTIAAGNLTDAEAYEFAFRGSVEHSHCHDIVCALLHHDLRPLLSDRALADLLADRVALLHELATARALVEQLASQLSSEHAYCGDGCPSVDLTLDARAWLARQGEGEADV